MSAGDSVPSRKLEADAIEAALIERFRDRIRTLRTRVRAPCAAHGRSLNLLLHGYAGGGNVGADIRTAEIARQIRSIFGPARVRLGYTSERPLEGRPFASLHWEPSDSDPGALVERYDAVIVCEGSLFKSTFANTMAISFIGSLGLAAAQDRLGVAYGAEAGAMDPGVARFAAEHCGDSLIFARSSSSYRRITEDLGLPARLGADTAWTFEPDLPEAGDALLRAAGWDGESPVVCAAPINPFWWPVRPDLVKAAALETTGRFKEIHRRSIFFHNDSDDARTKYSRYVTALATALKAFCGATGAFAVIVGMERLDRPVCLDLQSRLGGSAPVFVSGDHTPDRIVSLLRRASVIVSSRYHAIVTSMPGGVPAIGVSMDERIENLFAERGLPGSVLGADDPDLADRLVALLRDVRDDRERHTEGIAAFVGTQLMRMGEMGRALSNALKARTGFDALPGHTGARDYLPPLGARLADCLEEAR